MDSPNNPFYNAIAQLPTNKELSPAHKPSKSPARSIQVLQDVQPKKFSGPMGDSAIHLSPVEGSQPAPQPKTQADNQTNVGDSGIWSASSNFDLQQSQQSGVVSRPISENINFAPAGPDRDSAYRTAPEASSDPPQQLTLQIMDTVQPPSPKPRSLELLTDKPEDPKVLETVEQPKAKPLSFPDELKATEKSGQAASLKKAGSEPRRSGRLAERSLSPLPASTQPERANDFVPPSSPPVLSRQEISVADEEDAPTLPTAKSPSPSPVLAGSIRPKTPARSAESAGGSPVKSPAQTPQGSPSKSSSEPPTPDVPVIRKSILNFAALPAREPLTSKKKSLGMKSTRDSHVEQVRLNGTSRASWMNKKGSGKSLGASSRQIEQIEKQGKDIREEERARKPEVPSNRKRKSESVRDDSQKRSKGSTDGLNQKVDETEDMEEGSSGETSEAMALHNKAYTQRLQDKIQRLGKSREARSFPPSVTQVAGPSYPELPQADQQTQSILKRTKSDPQGQLPHTANPAARWTSHPDDEEEWIPMKQEPKRQPARSNTEGMTEPKQKEIETAESQSVHRWNNSPKQTLVPAPIAVRTTTISEIAPAFSLKSPTYPPKRHLPGSPLKSSFSDDWIKAPASPTRPPGEGAISAVKAHTTSVFKKAKQMLLNSSVSSVSAKIETMTPGLRSWHGGNNLRQQMVIDSDPVRSHEHEQLYPNLESAVDTKLPTPASANISASSIVAVEQATEPMKESKTRSSRSRGTGEGEVEEPAPKVQKKSKAAERAEREASRAILREREEKLREAEEVLRIAKEEQQRDREEEQLQQAKEQRRQKEEQARKEREEKVRKEKEESKRHQEERLRQEKEELRRRQQEELRRQEEAQKVNENRSNFQDYDDDDDISYRGEESVTESIRGRITSSAEPERPPSRLQKGGPRFQRTGDKNKPLRPGTADNSLPKPKPGPVSISVGTASQREMQSQRSKPNILTPSTLVAALKQSFELPGLQASSSQISLSSSVSANSLRVSNPTGSKQLKSLTAAANQLKKVCIISYLKVNLVQC